MRRRALLGIISLSACLFAAFSYMILYGVMHMHPPAPVNTAVLFTAVFGVPASLLIIRQSFIYKALILVLAAITLYCAAVVMVRLGFVVPHQEQCMLAGHHHGGGSDLPLVVSLFSVWYLAVGFIFLCIGIVMKFLPKSFLQSVFAAR